MMYNHAYDIAFSLETENKTGEVSGKILRAAILKRLDALTDEELEEATGTPFDTYTMEGD